MSTPPDTTAERVAEELRVQIIEGALPPGARLSEEQLAASTGVSRNTLREAFRLLGHERLLVHHLHRGVFVPVLDESDVADLYRLRRAVECDALRRLSPADAARCDRLEPHLQLAEEAATDQRWGEVGTANLRFHQDLVALAGSSRMDEVTRHLLAECRLLFHVIEPPEQLFGPYLPWNRTLFELVLAGSCSEAAEEMDRYLHHSEAALLAAFTSEERR